MTKENAMTDRLLTRRQLLATGGAASLLLLAPDVLRGAPAFAALPEISIGFVDTLGPLVRGMVVTPGRNLTNDASLTNALLKITVGGLHPTTDTAFPAASLDAVFTQNGSTFPFHALTHTAGPATNRASFVQVPGAAGLRFALQSGATSAESALGRGCLTRLRAGTYLFGLGARTWAQSTTLADTPAQRSLIVVIRPA